MDTKYTTTAEQKSKSLSRFNFSKISEPLRATQHAYGWLTEVQECKRMSGNVVG